VAVTDGSGSTVTNVAEDFVDIDADGAAEVESED
jgi:hypothetical protein